MTAALAAVWELLANFAADRIIDLLQLVGPVLYRLFAETGRVPE